MEHERKQPVGTYLVDEPVTYVNHYECAAWYQEVEVQPGEYQVYAWIENDHVKHFCVTLPGIVTASDFTAHYCGVRIGDKRNHDIGRAAHHTISARDYEVFRNIHVNPRTRWRIDLAALPNIGSCAACGAPYTIYGGTHLCPHCAAEDRKQREEAARRRWPRLIAAVDRTFLYLGAYLVASYVQDRQIGYYRRQIAEGLKRRKERL